ncbi:hypothetical protein [uncultured Gimesia sp.]|uniref:hypothetical protein n=1 Tax=uncultured Gimesia sp. TaxID=1678688 RepID=UPI002620ED7E|nr:hypothetical protein [uncultured Gimesia sp.]
MIETSTIPYEYEEPPDGEYRYDYYFMDIMLWVIGLPLFCLMLITPVAVLIQWWVWVGEPNLFCQILMLTVACVAMGFGVRIILRRRAEDYQSWSDAKEQHQRDVASGYADQYLIRNIIQYWPITDAEPLAGYLIRTSDDEWFYLISEELDEFEEDAFPKSQLTILSSPFSKEILKIETTGDEVEFVDWVEFDLFFDYYSDFHFEVLNSEASHILNASLLSENH